MLLDAAAVVVVEVEVEEEEGAVECPMLESPKVMPPAAALLLSGRTWLNTEDRMELAGWLDGGAGWGASAEGKHVLGWGLTVAMLVRVDPGAAEVLSRDNRRVLAESVVVAGGAAAAAAVVVVAGVFCIFLSESSSGLGLGWLPAGRALGSVVTVPAEVVAAVAEADAMTEFSSVPVGVVAALLELADGLVMPVTVELSAVAVLELRSRLAMAEGVGPKLEVVVGVNEATDWEEGVDLEGSISSRTFLILLRAAFFSESRSLAVMVYPSSGGGGRVIWSALRLDTRGILRLRFPWAPAEGGVEQEEEEAAVWFSSGDSFFASCSGVRSDFTGVEVLE